MYDTIHTPDYFSDLQYLTNGAAQGAAGDAPLPCLAQLLLFTLSIHGNTRPAQYGIAYKKSQCFLVIVLITEVFTSLSECGMVKVSTCAR